MCDTLKFEYLNSITCDCQVVILYCLWGILIHISLPNVKGWSTGKLIHEVISKKSCCYPKVKKIDGILSGFIKSVINQEKKLVAVLVCCMRNSNFQWCTLIL